MNKLRNFIPLVLNSPKTQRRVLLKNKLGSAPIFITVVVVVLFCFFFFFFFQLAIIMISM